MRFGFQIPFQFMFRRSRGHGAQKDANFMSNGVQMSASPEFFLNSSSRFLLHECPNIMSPLGLCHDSFSMMLPTESFACFLLHEFCS